MVGRHDISIYKTHNYCGACAKYYPKPTKKCPIHGTELRELPKDRTWLRKQRGDNGYIETPDATLDELVQELGAVFL